jgi:ABC-type multidrug transport system fused ATPase/permease subunit
VTRYRGAFLVGFACIVATTALGLAGPWVLKYAIDDLTAGVTVEKLQFYGAALLGLTAVGGVFRFLQPAS